MRPPAATRPKACCPGAARRPNCGRCTRWPWKTSARSRRKTKELVDWLLAHRTGNRWSPEKATGPAALALCRWFADSRFQGERYKLTVYVNDVRVKVLDIDPAAGSQTIDVPRRFLKIRSGISPLATQRGETPRLRSNSASISRSKAAGSIRFSASLGGFVPADKLKSTTKDWRVTRHYEPAPLELDGREIPRGLPDLEGNFTPFRNALNQLPVGRRGMVDINLLAERLEHARRTAGVSGRHRADPQRGDSHREIGHRPVRALRDRSRRDHLLHRQPHRFGHDPLRALRLRARHLPRRPDGRPQRPSAGAIARCRAKSLAVLPQGAKSADPYRLTPQELYELGKRLAAKKELFRRRRAPDRPGRQLEPAARGLQGCRADAAWTSIWRLGRPRRSSTTSRSSRSGGPTRRCPSPRSSRSAPPTTRWASTSGAISSSAPRWRAISPARAKSPASSNRKASCCVAWRR